MGTWIMQTILLLLFVPIGLLFATDAKAEHYCEARFGGPYANVYDQMEKERLKAGCYQIRTADGNWK